MALVMGVPLHILPNPSPEERLAVYSAADIFVSPSDNMQETFGLTLLEAGAAELPAVVSDWDGYRDIIVHDETGFLVPVLAPIVRKFWIVLLLYWLWAKRSSCVRNRRPWMYRLWPRRCTLLGNFPICEGAWAERPGIGFCGTLLVMQLSGAGLSCGTG